MMRTHFYALVSSLLLLVGCTAGLDGPDRQPQCDAERRCAGDQPAVCGVDGVRYPCASQAGCLGVPVDPFGEACRTDVVQDCPAPQVCPIGCDTFVRPDGCETCTCDEEPPPQCEEIQCANWCPNGYGTDEDGCPSCWCLPEEGCGDVFCPEAEGCYLGDGCECVCDTCPPIDEEECLAQPGCKIAYDDADDGCASCECEPVDPPICEQHLCYRACPYGHLMIDGCPTCECNEPCDDLICEVDCPRQVDPRTGCVSGCACAEPECPDVDCALACEHGFRPDPSGCETCECRGASCSSNAECPAGEWCNDFGGTALVGECWKIEACETDADCPDNRPCGFFYEPGCCPPLTNCEDSLPGCPLQCL